MSVRIYPAIHIQDRPTRGALAGESHVRKTRSKTYTDSPRGREKRGRKWSPKRRYHATTRQKHDVSLIIVQTGHVARRDDSPPASTRGATRFVELNNSDSIVPRSGWVNGFGSDGIDGERSEDVTSRTIKDFRSNCAGPVLSLSWPLPSFSRSNFLAFDLTCD